MCANAWRKSQYLDSAMLRLVGERSATIFLREVIVEILDQRVIVEFPQVGGIGGYAVAGARDKIYLIGQVVKPDHWGGCAEEDCGG